MGFDSAHLPKVRRVVSRLVCRLAFSGIRAILTPDMGHSTWSVQEKNANLKITISDSAQIWQSCWDYQNMQKSRISSKSDHPLHFCTLPKNRLFGDFWAKPLSSNDDNSGTTNLRRSVLDSILKEIGRRIHLRDQNFDLFIFSTCIAQLKTLNGRISKQPYLFFKFDLTIVFPGQFYIRITYRQKSQFYSICDYLN